MQLNQPRPISAPSSYWYIVGTSVILALAPTLAMDIDLRTAEVFAQTGKFSEARHWWWIELINLYVPALFRAGIFVSLAIWLVALFSKRIKHWRKPLAFIVLAGALGPGLVVNAVFKEHWQRARPYQVAEFGGSQQFTRAGMITDQCQNNCSFVSGHVACGFFLTSLLLVTRRRRVWAVAGIASGLIIGLARMADSAHWLSDVLWACPITLLTSWLVWKVVSQHYPDPR